MNNKNKNTRIMKQQVIIHRAPTGTYALQYRQGEATRVRKPYIAPVVEQLTARVERGFALSGGQPGNEPNLDDAMAEGLYGGGIIVF